MNGNAFFAANKVKNATSCLTISEANPKIFGNADMELGFIVPMMQGARPPETVTGSVKVPQYSIAS